MNRMANLKVMLFSKPGQNKQWYKSRCRFGVLLFF